MTALAPRMKVPHVPPAEPPLPEPFTLDGFAKVAGWHGVFRVLGANRDGSLRLYGGAAGRLAHRSVFADRCRLATADEVARHRADLARAEEES